MAPEFVTLEEIAKILKISKSTVHKNWHKWGIKPWRPAANGAIRLPLNEVLSAGYRMGQ